MLSYDAHILYKDMTQNQKEQIEYCLQRRPYDYNFCREKFASTILDYLRDNYEILYNSNDRSF
jgi:hypothetical protein